MYMCKGRHLDWFEIKIAMLLKGLGFSRRTIADSLRVNEASLRQREERIASKIKQGNKQDLEELYRVIEIILKDENSYITKRFYELFKKCEEIEKMKYSKMKKKEKERCEEMK